MSEGDSAALQELRVKYASMELQHNKLENLLKERFDNQQDAMAILQTIQLQAAAGGALVGDGSSSPAPTGGPPPPAPPPPPGAGGPPPPPPPPGMGGPPPPPPPPGMGGPPPPPPPPGMGGPPPPPPPGGAPVKAGRPDKKSKLSTKPLKSFNWAKIPNHAIDEVRHLFTLLLCVLIMLFFSRLFGAR